MFQPTAITFDAERSLSAAPAASSYAKRLMDIAIAGSVVFLLLPLFIVLAAAIYLESGGPIVFRQRRGGVLGRPFVVLKFRTMLTTDDGEHVKQATRGDSRVTKVGAFLRKTSLDELPQLINVLKGDMSLVGPRPHALAHDREFQRLIPAYERRFAVKPGITGLAQVRGFRGETRQVEDIAERVACDIEYVETWSFWSDLKLLVMTLKVPIDAKAY